MNIKIKLKKIFILPIIIILCVSLGSYYFGAYSFYYKIFPFSPKKTISETNENIDTNYYKLNVSKFNLPIHSKYGGVEILNNKILYISGDGELYNFKDKDNGKFEFKKIKIDKIINNKEKFIEKHADELGLLRVQNDFSIKDFHIASFNSNKKKFLLVSSLFYDDLDNCYNLSIYKNEILDEEKLIFSKWQNFFFTNKCLTTTLTPKEKFAVASAGGRIFKLDENNILVTIGDFYADGVNGPNFSQDLTNDYGKILKINFNTGKDKIYTHGHRNPQGLFITKNNKIFSTEHGPDGGDELNIIVEGNNYGWPIATYGTNYTKYKWPLDTTNNTHDGYFKPIFSWGPKFGISNLIRYNSNYFNKWKNNLIITSLVSQSLTRLIFDDEKNKINYYEQIKIGSRIRDIAQTKDGQIVLLTDTILREKIPELIILKKD